MTPLGALAGLTPGMVRDLVALVRYGLVIDLSIPLDPTLLPSGDPEFNQPGPTDRDPLNR
jgi:hypothetical protein